MRPDGTRVRDLTAIMQALPYVMPKRYDAQNWAEENLDEDAIRDYIRAKRREGRPVPDPLAPEGVRKKIMPMSVVMDERIATGIEYSRFFAELFRNLKHPESLEEPFNSVLAEKAAVK